MVTHSRAPVRAHRLRPLNVPRPIEVELDDDGLPTRIMRSGQSRRIDEITETWRIDDEWWRETIARRYVEMILEGGERTVIYEDELGEGWYEQR